MAGSRSVSESHYILNGTANVPRPRRGVGRDKIRPVLLTVVLTDPVICGSGRVEENL